MYLHKNKSKEPVRNVLEHTCNNNNNNEQCDALLEYVYRACECRRWHDIFRIKLEQLIKKEIDSKNLIGRPMRPMVIACSGRHARIKSASIYFKS